MNQKHTRIYYILTIPAITPNVIIMINRIKIKLKYFNDIVLILIKMEIATRWA